MPITKEQREKFSTDSGEHKNKAAEMLEKIKELRQQETEKDEFEVPYLRFQQCFLMCDVVDELLTVNQLSQTIMGIKSEASLDEARKKIYEILMILEQLTFNIIDIELSEVVKKQKMFPLFKDDQRLELAQRLFYQVDRIAQGYGDNSKWAVSFVEIRGRVTNMAKNLLDYIALRSKNDPREEGFNERRRLRELVEEKLITSAKEYREKYEVSGHNTEDMKKALDLLRTLGRIYIVENKQVELDKIKKTIALWKQKMEKDTSTK